MSLVEELQHGIIHGFDRTDYKEAAGITQRRQVLLVFEQVFNLDGHVIRNGGKFTMKRFDEFQGVTDAVKKIRIAEGDVLGAGGYLAADIFQHYISADDSKDAVINRNDGTMPAKVLAAATCFC